MGRSRVPVEAVQENREIMCKVCRFTVLAYHKLCRCFVEGVGTMEISGVGSTVRYRGRDIECCL